MLLSPCTQEKLEGSAGGKGTGGTDLMKFLKPIRDNCGERFATH
jgi:Indoleamine 2,3-dioxygenase